LYAAGAQWVSKIEAQGSPGSAGWHGALAWLCSSLWNESLDATCVWPQLAAEQPGEIVKLSEGRGKLRKTASCRG